MAKSDLRVGISADSSKFDKAMSDVRNTLSKTKQDTKKSTDDVSKDYEALSGKLKDALDNISGGMLSQFKEGYDMAKNIVGVLGNMKTVELFKGGADGLKTSFSELFEGLGTNLTKTAAQTAAVSSATSAMTQSLTSAGSAAVVAGNGMKGYAKSLTDVGDLKAQVEYIRDAQKNIENLKQSYTELEYSLTYVSGMLDELARTGADSLNGFTADQLKEEYSALEEQMKSINDEISSTSTNLENLGIESKSIGDTLRGVGEKMVNAFKGLGNALIHPKDTLNSIWKGIQSGCSKALTAIKTFSYKSAAYIAVASAGITVLITAIATVVAALGSFYTRTEDGQRKMQQFTAKVKGAFEGVGDALSAIGKKLSDITSSTSRFGNIIYKVVDTFVLTPIKIVLKSINWLIKAATGVDIYASMVSSSEKALKIEKERQKMQTWWEGSVDGTTKSMRLQVNEAKTQVEELREQVAATTDVAKKQELINQMLEKQKWINEQNKKYRDWELKIAQDTFDANDSNADAQKELNDLKERLYNEEQADLKALTRIQRQLNGSVEKGVEKLEESAEAIRNMQKWADALGVSVKVTKDNLSDVEKELTAITESRGLSFSLINNTESLQDEMKRLYGDKKLTVPVKPEIDEEEAFSYSQSTIQQLQDTVNKFMMKDENGIKITVNQENFDSVKESAEKAAQEYQKTFNDIVKDGLAQGITSVFESLGEAFVDGDFTQVFATMMENLASMLKQFGSALVAYGVAVIAFKAAMATPWTAIAAGAALAVAGGVLGAVANKLKAKDFAEGGIVYGETYARVAEYSGARNNPEVIAPLDRLKSILSDTNSTIGGDVRFEISGDKLVGVLNNRNRRVSKYS